MKNYLILGLGVLIFTLTGCEKASQDDAETPHTFATLYVTTEACYRQSDPYCEERKPLKGVHLHLFRSDEELKTLSNEIASGVSGEGGSVTFGQIDTNIVHLLATYGTRKSTTVLHTPEGTINYHTVTFILQ